MLSAENERKLRLRQAEYIKKSSKHKSYSQTINEVIEAGLKK